jgi:hypothetical protein
MIESILIILIGFVFLFYFIHLVNKKIEMMNDYQLGLFRKDYSILLRTSKEYSGQIKEITRHVSDLEKKVGYIMKHIDESKNVVSLKTKKMEEK